MQVPEALRLASFGARDLEKAARRDCTRHRALLAAGADLGLVVGLYPAIPPQEISQAALLTGLQHERTLFAAGAAQLIEAAVAEGRLAPGEIGFEDLRETYADAPGRMRAVRGRRAARTRQLLRDYFDGEPTPAVVAHATLEVRRSGASGFVELDALLLSAVAGVPRIVEKKTFLDAQGFTDADAMRGLQRQGAVEVLALQQAVRSISPALVERVPLSVDIVLRGPRLYLDTPVDGPLAQVAEFVERFAAAAYEDEVAAAAEAAGQVAGQAALDAALVDQLVYDYDEGCRQFCPMAPKCRRDAEAADQLVTLGRGAAGAFAPARSRTHLTALGAGAAAPADADESLLVERLRAADRELTNIGHAPRRIRL